MIFCRLLGAPDLQDPSGKRLSSVLNQPKRFALLAYLAVEAVDAPVPRDKLALLFWPELDQMRARRALRQALHVLRGELGDDLLKALGDELVAIDPAVLDCDVRRFREAVAEDRDSDALDLYRGAFLDAFHLSDAPEFEAWSEQARSDLRVRAYDAATRLAARARDDGKHDDAVRRLRRALDISPANEATARDLMSALRDAGDRAGALAAYEELTARFRSDFEMTPSAATEQLAAAIREAGPPAAQVARVPMPQPSVVSPQNRERSGPGRRRSYAAYAAVALLAVAVSAWMARDRWLLPAAPAADPASVAVLPFVDMSAAKDQEYFSDGLTEELLTALSRVRALRVTARTSSFAFKNTTLEVGEIARRLGVRSVLEGSVRMAGDSIRITAQLIDATTGFHLWSETYDRRLSDVFAIQEEISRAIVNALKLELIERPSLRLVDRSTSNAAAYDAYLRGLYFWNQRGAEGVRRSIEYFDMAIARDSTFAAAYAGLATAYQLAPSFDLLPPREAFPRARRAVDAALRLDPGLPEAHASLGYIRMQHERDWAGAEAELRRAIELNPGYATAYQWLRLVLLATGRGEDAVRAAREAQRLDPLSLSIQAALGDTYFYTRRYEQAVAEYLAALELDPQYDRARLGLGRAYFALGRTSTGLREHRAAMAREAGNSRFAALLGYALARGGQRPAADSILGELRREQRSRYVPAYAFAALHAGLGNADSTNAWVAKAVDEQDNYAVFLGVDPVFDTVRSSRDFQRAIRRLIPAESDQRPR